MPANKRASGDVEKKKGKNVDRLEILEKSPTGIKGFEDITFGGLPKGRPTLVSGGAGSGKTMLAMEFIVHGATEFNEPGVFVTFEENVNDLKQNFASIGYDLEKLIEEKKIIIDHVFLRSQPDTGDWRV